MIYMLLEDLMEVQKQKALYPSFNRQSQITIHLLQLFNIDESTGLPKTDDDVQQLYDYLYTSAEYGMQVSGLLHKDGNEYTATILRVYVDLGSNSDDMTKQFEQLNKELNDDLADYGETTSIITGNLLITLSILKNMTESQILSTGDLFHSCSDYAFSDLSKSYTWVDCDDSCHRFYYLGPGNHVFYWVFIEHFNDHGHLHHHWCWY